MAFLKQEFPELRTVVIPGYEVTYDKKGSSLKLFYESLHFFNFIKKEHDFLDEIIKTYDIQLIVSDNRYGLWNKKVKSIIITHQLYIKAPLGEKMAHKKIEKLLSNFDECWIPDTSGEPNLSGDLSHLKPFKHPHKFIGPLSRFSKNQFVTSSIFEERKNVSRSNEEFKYDIIAILSGPEPQRTIFEKLVLEQLSKNKLKAVIVRGLPSLKVTATSDMTLSTSCESKSIEKSTRTPEKIKIFNHLGTQEILNYIQKSKIVICRAGYSSIMDLAALGKQAILVPTPGQTEQEYLAEYHHKKGNFISQKQNKFDLEKALIEGENYCSKKQHRQASELKPLLE